MSVQARLQALAERWSSASRGELANAQLYLTDLCEALDVERPRPRGSGYEFEYPLKVVRKHDGSEASRRVDLYKEGHFLLEAKDDEKGRSNDWLLMGAFGQANEYAAYVPGERPPYLMVMDVAQTLLIWDRWSGAYGGFQAAHRIDLRTLHERPKDISLLRDIWENPHSRDPHAKAEAVTKEIAEKLAVLSRQLEERGHDPEVVARFLMRCVFTMFAEDIGLLPQKYFESGLENLGMRDPEQFMDRLATLWSAMDKGESIGLDARLLRFNGHFFRDQATIPLTRDDIAVLLEAAKADWAMVEPTIFGTLLTRALNPDERHRLGAEYTPRPYVERLVRPTVEEPIRERWTAVEAEVLQLRERGRPVDRKNAENAVREFVGWLRTLRFLDPACGSGNFLYVTLIVVKQVELEARRLLESITGAAELAIDEVAPDQFFGIEVKPWAREIAELTLWIGYHQFWKATHGHVQPPEPVLQETNTIECRDAVLAWEGQPVHRPDRDRPDPTPRIEDPVTGDLVPDPNATLPYMEYVNARPAEWPDADFIIGNPPYIGQARMRDAFGDGYTEGLRGAYPDVPKSADLVMYWWHRAAREIAEGRTIRSGLITTNSIVQSQNRKIVEAASEDGVDVCWAVADHPWVDESDGADVRVAMTVVARDSVGATLLKVDDSAKVICEAHAGRLNADLTAHADVARAASTPLLAGEGLSSPGVKLHGRGFKLKADEAEPLIEASPDLARVVRPYLNGRDLTKRSRGLYVIDFGLMDEPGARQYPQAFDIVRSRVKPHRDTNNDRSTRENWWRFGRNREDLREALDGLARYVATPETAKHRFFQFLDAEITPDNRLVCIASEDAYPLGVLSSQIHVTWAEVAGGRMESGSQVYTKSKCFDPFPFPDASADQRQQIGDIAEMLDQHRTAAIERNEKVTMTGMYNVVEKLRSGEKLTKKERELHTIAACGVLKDLHDELDEAVAEAYGWEWPLTKEPILDRLVALHDERVAEEEQGFVRWLRPDYQKPKFGTDLPEPDELELDMGTKEGDVEQAVEWPAKAADQIQALLSVTAEEALSVAEVRRAFIGAPRKKVETHLEALTAMGALRIDDDGRYYAA